MVQILDLVSSTEREFEAPLLYADIVRTLREKSSSGGTIASGHSTSGGTGTNGLRIKITVPNIAEFSFEPEEYYGWKRDGRNAFGAASMRAVVTDQNFHATNPELSEAALRWHFLKALPILLPKTCKLQMIYRRIDLSRDWTRNTTRRRTRTISLLLQFLSGVTSRPHYYSG